MDETPSAAPSSDQHLHYSLRQIIAVTTAVGAGLALFFLLISPPLGSSGLSWAILPSSVLAGALWVSCTETSARMATYTIVASAFALLFFGRYVSQTDWLFGHTHGPPQLVFATCWASTIGVLSGGGWLLCKLGARQTAAAPDSGDGRPTSNSAGWFGGLAVVAATLLSGLLAFGSLSSVPHARKRMGEYIKQRQVRAEWMAASRARAREFSLETPEEAERKCALYMGLSNQDEAVRYQAARDILAYQKITDSQTRINAVQMICTSPHRHDGDVEELIVQGTITKDEAARGLGQAIGQPVLDDTCRKEIARTLGRLGPAAAIAAGRLARELEEPRSANVRSEVADALAAIGPAGKDNWLVVNYFHGAWQKHLLTVEQAQALYKIDHEAAEKLEIPSP